MHEGKKEGFTLIELLIVIVILGILAAFVSGNFFSSLKKGRDARRKADLNNVKKALEMYYEDNLKYPDKLTWGFPLIDTKGRMYIKRLPKDPTLGCSYKYEHVSSPQEGWRLYSIIENPLDSEEGVNQSGYTGKNCGCGTCKYMITSSNLEE